MYNNPLTVVGRVSVIGNIWQPGIGMCAMDYPVTNHDLDSIEEITRDNVEYWLMANSGDFKSIIDFSATINDVVIPWENEESEIEYIDCMYPEYD